MFHFGNFTHPYSIPNFTHPYSNFSHFDTSGNFTPAHGYETYIPPPPRPIHDSPIKSEGIGPLGPLIGWGIGEGVGHIVAGEAATHLFDYVTTPVEPMNFPTSGPVDAGIPGGVQHTGEGEE